MSRRLVRLRPETTAAIPIVIVAALLGGACGKKGPPLPPLVKLPVAPADLTAARRGAQVGLQFTVPAANTDGTRPANIERVDVYGFTGPENLADDLVLKHATRVASVAVKAPRDPNATVEAGEPDEEMEPPEGVGLDQGAIARVEEALIAAALMPIDVTKAAGRNAAVPAEQDEPGPLLGPPPGMPSRTYVSVGLSTRGRKGPLSKRVTVPLTPPPPAPTSPVIQYDETTITLTWTPGMEDRPQMAAGAGVLRSHPLGLTLPSLGYNVYEVPPPAAEAGAPPATAVGLRLTETPVADLKYADARIEWGTERCYVVRSIETTSGLSVESDASEPGCVRPVDTFAPAAPRGLVAVATEGAISLIWEPNGERDLAGYFVLRAAVPGEPEPIVNAPIQDTTFRDTVKAGIRYVYVVRAVDKAGNVSPISNRVEETAR